MRWRTRSTDPQARRTRVEHHEQPIGPEIYPKIRDLVTRGANVDEVINRVLEVTELTGHQIVADLRRTSPRMLREHRHLKRKFHREINKVWGTALDRLYEVYVCSEELGSNLLCNEAAADAVSEALTGLHARACLVIGEVHALLAAGFPLAAMSRARTLHETAVIALVIGAFGREDKTADLAVRFLEHWIVDVARDYQLAQDAEMEVDLAELDYVTGERDRLVTKYGRIYGFNYGWAACLFPDLRPNRDRVNFLQLEQRAETELSRLDYQLQNPHVHASSLTIMLHKYERDGRNFYVTGPTGTGLAEPAVASLLALVTSTSVLALHALPDAPEPMDLVALAAIRELAVEAAAEFEYAQASLIVREAR